VSPAAISTIEGEYSIRATCETITRIRKPFIVVSAMPACATEVSITQSLFFIISF